MFNATRYVLFVGKQYIDPGLVTLKKEPLFKPGEALHYTPETLADALTRCKAVSSKKIRIVLAEELVYVALFAFPWSMRTHLTRDLIRAKAEESIPEDLQATQWDFQSMTYVAIPDQDKEILVQVAVMEKNFFQAFKQALDTTPLPIESILPESYVLARLAAAREGVSVIVGRSRTGIVFVAAEQGFVITTSLRPEGDIPADLSTFISFVASRKGKIVKRIILSHFSEEELPLFQGFSGGRYEVTLEDYNPLIGAAIQEKISGIDAAVLNIDVFHVDTRPYLWRRLFRKGSKTQ